MRTEVEPVVFNNRDKVKLHGILHSRDDARKDVAIIMLSPGIKSRVAPHRLYVKMAKRYSEMGFCVLRYDPHGIGDSEGEIEERMAAELYGSVQVGKYVKDTIDAMDWMQNELGISRFVLAGLCGGAITGLLTGAVDSRVCLLLGLGIPVILDNVGTDQSKYMTQGQLADVRVTYLRKLIDPKAWRRFLSLKSNFRLIYKSILSGVCGKAAGSISNNTHLLRESAGEKDRGNGQESNLNPLFPVALHKMLATRKVILIFSGADRLHWEFNEKYLNKYAKDYQTLKQNIDIHVIKNANHVLTFKEWQEEMQVVFSSALNNVGGHR